VRIIVENAAEAAILLDRWQAIAHTLGPMVELHCTLPDGRRLAKFKGGSSPAAQVRSLIEKAQDHLSQQ
jgi:hypothetical protein